MFGVQAPKLCFLPLLLSAIGMLYVVLGVIQASGVNQNKEKFVG